MSYVCQDSFNKDENFPRYAVIVGKYREVGRERMRKGKKYVVDNTVICQGSELRYSLRDPSIMHQASCKKKDKKSMTQNFLLNRDTELRILKKCTFYIVNVQIEEG